MLTKAIIILVLIGVNGVLSALLHSKSRVKRDADIQDLMLTPFIKAGEFEKARAASEDNMKLSSIDSQNVVKSHSGFLTVDESTNANLFFWFFPAQENYATAPTILMVNDIPGDSCLKSIFLETGPFYVDENMKLVYRNTSWSRSHSMLYIDAPVGSGFSFAENESGFAKSSADEANEIDSAMRQFFAIFKELRQTDFYLAGENYAASAIPNIISTIEKRNTNADAQINIKGIILGSPILHLLHQTEKAQFFRQLGLIDENQEMELNALNKKRNDLVSEGKLDEALKLIVSTYLGGESTAAKMMGFSDTASALAANAPAEIKIFEDFVSSKEVHKYLHVGLHKFVQLNNNVWKYFGEDSLKTDHVTPFQDLLDKGYRVLLYSGQFDILNTPDVIREMVNGFKWKGSMEFLKAPRKVWKFKDDVAGYVKMAGNLVFVTVRNAGNYAIMDQPAVLTKMVENFLSGTEF